MSRALDKHVGVVEIDPAAVSRPNQAPKLAGRKNDPRIPSRLKIQPAYVRAIGESAKVFLSRRSGRTIDAEVGSRCVRVTGAISGRASSDLYPADIRGVDKPRAKVRADIHTIYGARPPIGEPDVRGPRVVIGRIDRRICRGGCDADQDYCEGKAESLLHFANCC